MTGDTVTAFDGLKKKIEIPLGAVLKCVSVPSLAPVASFPHQQEKKQTAESVAEMICSVMRRVVARERPLSVQFFTE